MKKNILSKFSFLLLMSIIIASCGTKKKTVKLPTEDDKVVANDITSTFEMSNLNFITFSGKAKAKLEMGKESRDVTLNVRMERDKVIWVSVTALLGIEGARILITPDSVKIMNKLHGEYLAKPFTYIYNYVNPGISFRMLQDILVGNINMQMLRTDQLQVAKSVEDTQLIGVKDGLTFHYGINKEDRPFNFNLIELGKTNKLEANYSDYAVIDGHNFPQRFTLTIEGDGTKVFSDLQYTRADFNQNIELPFTVPSRYKVIK